MQFAIVALVLGLATFARAQDDRELIKFTQPASQFPSLWASSCQSYKPSDSNLKYQEAYYHAGDYQGANANNEALVFCAFAYPGSPNSPTLFTDEIIQEVGATKL